jgi:UDP-N-acetyl-D-mannosaminuronic acid dehydrogenase
MPEYVFNRIREINPQISKVLILGATFKKDCDDTRNSLSYKMVKVCKKHGVHSYMWDPHVEQSNEDRKIFLMGALKKVDAVIVMTPHTDMDEQWPLDMFSQDCIVADLWKMYPESKLSNTGIYKVGDML